MAPESALADLRSRAEAEGTIAPGSGISPVERNEIEKGILVRWANDTGLAVPADAYMSRIEDTRGEHHVYFDPQRERYFKITHGVELDRAGFALTVRTKFHIGRKTQRFIGEPHLREATPFEYLTRLQLFNRTFYDTIEVEGVIVDSGREAIVISQPFIHGNAASENDVAGFMNMLGFAVIPGIRLGKANSVSFLRLRDGVAVFDTHGENFLVSGPRVVPIDAVMISSDEELLAYLTMTPEERSDELG
jgi:Serine/Threonine/Tyrosine Kinase found in polyvalent proteins